MRATPLNAFPLKLDWEMTRPRNAGPEPFPAPLVVSRLATDLPMAVKSLQGLADAFGWRILPTEAQGWYPHATTGRPGSRPKRSLAVRMRRGDQGAVAVYVEGSTWSWEYLYAWSPTNWIKLKTFGAFMDMVIGPMAALPSWADWMRARVAMRDARGLPACRALVRDWRRTLSREDQETINVEWELTGWWRSWAPAS